MIKFEFDATGKDFEVTKHLLLHEINTGKAKIVKFQPLAIIAFRMLRDEIGKPLTINSGYRSLEYNRTIKKSSDKSPHIKGIALDISAHNIDGGVPALVEKCEEVIETIRNQGNLLVPGYLGSYAARFIDHDIYGGIGTYNSFVHIDVRREKARWNG